MGGAEVARVVGGCSSGCTLALCEATSVLITGALLEGISSLFHRHSVELLLLIDPIF